MAGKRRTKQFNKMTMKWNPAAARFNMLTLVGENRGKGCKGNEMCVFFFFYYLIGNFLLKTLAKLKHIYL